MTQKRFFPFRGMLTDVMAVDHFIYFTTIHSEKMATGIYCLDTQKYEVHQISLPEGAHNLVRVFDTICCLGTDGAIYKVKPIENIAEKLMDITGTAIHPVGENTLAVVSKDCILILSLNKERVVQTLQLDEKITSISVSADGLWISVGLKTGTVVVFECEDKVSFEESDRKRVHEGAVTALCFMKDSLRFVSAGTDLKLFLTHARGKLEPEDKGRSYSQKSQIEALSNGPNDRFYSGTSDGTVLSWPSRDFKRPKSLSFKLKGVVAIETFTQKGKPHLVIASEDNALHLFKLESDGKVGDALYSLYGVKEWAENECLNEDSKRREDAIEMMSLFADGDSVAFLSEHIKAEKNPELALLGVKGILLSGHPTAFSLLSNRIAHPFKLVRQSIFDALTKLSLEGDLTPMKLALKTIHKDVGLLAIDALKKLAPLDDMARQLLETALNRKPFDVRKAALHALEDVTSVKSVDVNLLALLSHFPDTRKYALIRLFKRKLVHHPKVLSAIRKSLEDESGDVRRVAFILSLTLKENLAEVLRSKDEDIHYKLSELETYGEMNKGTPPERPLSMPADLSEEDLLPLFWAVSSRASDTCLSGAKGLSLLKDPRAMGFLLQLSQNREIAIRVGVATSLAHLNNPQCMMRLRLLLNDPAPEVRSAAFRALKEILQANPLNAVEIGLNAVHEDVKRLGVEILVETAKSSCNVPDDYFLKALNDECEVVRKETFKAVLKITLKKSNEKTIDFLLKSRNSDIRKACLTEIMAEISAPWAKAFLLTLFNDSDRAIRMDAFEFALLSFKKEPFETLEKAIQSHFSDVREKGMLDLIQHTYPFSIPLLVELIEDKKRQIRERVLLALIDLEAEDALIKSLSSSFPDVKVNAAKSLAIKGESRIIDPLKGFLLSPIPEEKSCAAEWVQLKVLALESLGILGAPQSFEVVASFLTSDHLILKRASAKALAFIAGNGIPTAALTLKNALKESDSAISHWSAFGLLLMGDAPSGASFFDGSGVFSTKEKMMAATLFARDNALYAESLFSYLDSDHPRFRKMAMAVILMLALKNSDGTPKHIIGCLSSKFISIRFWAVRALDQFLNPKAFRNVIVDFIYEGIHESHRAAYDDMVDILALLISHGSSKICVQSVSLLFSMIQNDSENFSMFWEVFHVRYRDEIRNLQISHDNNVQISYEKEALNQMAFGTYVGLCCEEGNTRENKMLIPSHFIRHYSVTRLLEMAEEDENMIFSVSSVLIHVLEDTHGNVRAAAFNALLKLGQEFNFLGTKALETGYTDMGREGLKLLTKDQAGKTSHDILKKVMLNREDGIELEAAKLMQEKIDASLLGRIAMGAISQPLRNHGIMLLLESYDMDERAVTFLKEGLNSRYKDVRFRVAKEMAERKAPFVFDALKRFLADTKEKKDQAILVEIFGKTGAQGIPDVFLGRIKNDPNKSADIPLLLKATADYRDTESFYRIKKIGEEKGLRRVAFDALLKISGYDQPLSDETTESSDLNKKDVKHPFHDDLLHQILGFCLFHNDKRMLKEVLPKIEWSKSGVLNEALSDLLHFPDDDFKVDVLTALCFRVRHRKQLGDVLLNCLTHKLPVIQFLAAEGLALVGRSEGIHILLSSINLMDDIHLRRRAVSALGALKDMRAFDMLLKLADDRGHALQLAAIESIGHMKNGGHGDEIFHRLKHFVKENNVLSERALKGLRWFNSSMGWQLIENKALDYNFRYRRSAVSLLQFKNSETVRKTLLHILKNDTDTGIGLTALESARKLWGKDQIEPDIAMLQNPLMDQKSETSLQRVIENSTAREIIALIPLCGPQTQKRLEHSLITQTPLPIQAAGDAINGNQPEAIKVCARILGRCNEVPSNHMKNLEKALKYWISLKEAEACNISEMKITPKKNSEKKMAACLRWLIWAAGRLNIGKESILRCTGLFIEDERFNAVRHQAFLSLSFQPLESETIPYYENAISGNDDSARYIAAFELGRTDRSLSREHLNQLLSDGRSFSEYAKNVGSHVSETLSLSSESTHFQHYSLTHLIKKADVDRLHVMVCDQNLSLTLRLNAIDGLSVMGDANAEEMLAAFAKTDNEDMTLKKAAWRGIRRSKRKRERTEMEYSI